MKREDEYRQLASDILQRASEEQSAVLQAQWEILSASFSELAGQQTVRCASFAPITRSGQVN